MIVRHPPFLKEAQHRILILSEDPHLGGSMGCDLNRLGLHAFVDTNFSLFKTPTKALPYDGIILDLDTSESCKFQVFRNFTAAYPEIPVVVIGTESMYYDILFAYMGGAKDFLVKPVDSVFFKHLCLRLFL